MIVDIGGGTSEVAVISLGGIVVSQSIRVGGDELDEAIINYVKREYKLLIGQQTAEEVKLEIGSAYPMEEEVQAEIRGRDMVSGLPKTVVLTSRGDPRGARGAARRRSSTPSRRRSTGPRRSSHPTSWTAASCWRAVARCCRGSTSACARRRRCPSHLAESPLTCVAVGSGRSLEEFEVIKRTADGRRGRRAPRRAYNRY